MPPSITSKELKAKSIKKAGNILSCLQLKDVYIVTTDLPFFKQLRDGSHTVLSNEVHVSHELRCQLSSTTFVFVTWEITSMAMLSILLTKKYNDSKIWYPMI